MNDITLLRAEDVAAILDVHVKTLYRMIRDGRFPASTSYAGQKRWRSDIVQTWILAQSAAA